MRKSYISIRPDVRSFENSADMFGRCRKCGCQLVVLPDDRRFGFCFDCLDFLSISKKTDMENGRAFSLPHDNGFSLR